MEKARSFQRNGKNAKISAGRLQFHGTDEGTLGKVPSSKMVSLDCYEPMNLSLHSRNEACDKLFRLKRIRYADGIPLMKENNLLYDVFKPTKDAVRRPPLYEALQWANARVYFSADEEFSASIPTPEEAEVLDAIPWKAVYGFHANHIKSWNRIIEYTISVARSATILLQKDTIAQTTKNIWGYVSTN